MKRIHVLVVDDEPAILRYVHSNLTARGFEVISAKDGYEALDALQNNTADIVVLDIMMPGMDGLEVCRRIREKSSIPIVVLSALGAETEKVAALDLGADDYLTKPFGVEELLARLRAVLRRTRQIEFAGGEGATNFSAGPLEIDFESRRVVVSGREVKLTATEYHLLREFVINRDKAITHRDLLTHVWGSEYRTEKEYLRVFVQRLRRKLEADPANPTIILTETGVGYRFRTPASKA